MSKVKITGNASGTGVVTITAPNTSTDRTITLPDATGTLLNSGSTLNAANLSGTLPALDGAALTNLPGGGKVLQVLSATKTDRISTTSTTFIDVPGLSLTVTPASASSKFYLVVAVAGGGSESSEWSGMKLNLLRDSTSIGMGDTGYGTRTFGVGSGLGARPYYSTLLYGGNYLDSPATTSSITYKIQYSAVNYGGTTGYINRNQGSGTSAYDSSASSTITLMEIAG